MKKGHCGEIVVANFSTDANYLMTGSFDSTIQIWDLRTTKPLHTLIGHRAEISNAVFNYTGSKVLSGSLDSTGKVWDMVTGRCIETLW